jgi:hypothetical protein
MEERLYMGPLEHWHSTTGVAGPNKDRDLNSQIIEHGKRNLFDTDDVITEVYQPIGYVLLRCVWAQVADH